MKYSVRYFSTYSVLEKNSVNKTAIPSFESVVANSRLETRMESYRYLAACLERNLSWTMAPGPKD